MPIAHEQKNAGPSKTSKEKSNQGSSKRYRQLTQIYKHVAKQSGAILALR